MLRTKWNALWEKLLDWIDCRPRTLAYISFLLAFNYVWDATGHWPIGR